MVDQLDAQGHPAAGICRWCGTGRPTHRGALLCRTCDGPAHMIAPDATLGTE